LNDDLLLQYARGRFVKHPIVQPEWQRHERDLKESDYFARVYAPTNRDKLSEPIWSIPFPPGRVAIR
jgi:hypothetical protein